MREEEGIPRMKKVALELFGGLAASYDRTLDLATLLQDRYWKRWVVERTGPGRGKLLLDVGSGTMVLEERLSGKGFSVVGVDLTKKMIQMGKGKRLGDVVLLVNGDAEALPFRDGAFDVVASCYVAKYVSLPDFAREMGRIVRPGGTIALYDFVRPRGAFSLFLGIYVYGLMRILGFLMGVAGKDSAFTFQNLPEIVGQARWDDTLERLMQANGFQTRSLQRLSGGVVSAYWGAKRL